MVSLAKVTKYLAVGTYVAVVLSLILFIVELVRRGTERHIIGWVIAFTFVCLAVPLSVQDVIQHLLHYTEPKVQRYVVRIIWMVPIYAIESFLSLFFREVGIYLETLRDGYEAYVIYSFLYFLIAYAGDEDVLVERLRQKPVAVGRHMAPFSWCLRPWRLGREYLHKCKVGTLQYVVIKVVGIAATIALEYNGVYAEGEIFDFTRGYAYIAWISNFSQIWAIYCLMMFYKASLEELTPMRPFPKFLCIKLVVFFSFWQYVAIAVLVQLKIITRTIDYSEEDVAKGLQNFLICIEMFFAAIAHRRYFSYRDFERITRSRFVEVHRPSTHDHRLEGRGATGDASSSGGVHTGHGGGGSGGGGSGGGSQARGFVSAFLESTVPLDVIRDVGKKVLRRERRGSDEELLPHQAGLDGDAHEDRVHVAHRHSPSFAVSEAVVQRTPTDGSASTKSQRGERDRERERERDRDGRARGALVGAARRADQSAGAMDRRDERRRGGGRGGRGNEEEGANASAVPVFAGGDGVLVGRMSAPDDDVGGEEEEDDDNAFDAYLFDEEGTGSTEDALAATPASREHVVSSVRVQVTTPAPPANGDTTGAWLDAFRSRADPFGGDVEDDNHHIRGGGERSGGGGGGIGGGGGGVGVRGVGGREGGSRRPGDAIRGADRTAVGSGGRGTPRDSLAESIPRPTGSMTIRLPGPPRAGSSTGAGVRGPRTPPTAAGVSGSSPATSAQQLAGRDGMRV